MDIDDGGGVGVGWGVYIILSLASSKLSDTK